MWIGPGTLPVLHAPDQVQGGILRPLYPMRYGSAGHCGSALKDDGQPFYQSTVIGSGIHERFLMTGLKELLHSNFEKVLFCVF